MVLRLHFASDILCELVFLFSFAKQRNTNLFIPLVKRHPLNFLFSSISNRYPNMVNALLRHRDSCHGRFRPTFLFFFFCKPRFDSGAPCDLQHLLIVTRILYRYIYKEIRLIFSNVCVFLFSFPLFDGAQP